MSDYSDESAFQFSGRLSEYLGIALPNLALTFVTLGFYRFWATTRERRYLWSRTSFIDDSFEWTGSGKELFLGFLTALALFIVPVTLLYLIGQGLVLGGHKALATGLGLCLSVLVIYLTGFATFRGLRYRLSRSYWHGIHGGSDNPGWRYGWDWLWRTLIGYGLIGLMVPWAMTTLWKKRWEGMSFGSHAFQSRPDFGTLMLNYLMIFIAPLVVIGVPLTLIALTMAGGGHINPFDQDNALVFALTGAFIIIFVYILWPLIAMVYYARYMSEVIGTLRIAGLTFEFGATAGNWIALFLGNLALQSAAYAVALAPLAALGTFGSLKQAELSQHAVTLVIIGIALAVPVGIARAIIRFRKWRFYVRHLEATGEIDLAMLTQSTTRAPSQGEGLLDALEIGAI